MPDATPRALRGETGPRRRARAAAALALLVLLALAPPGPLGPVGEAQFNPSADLAVLTFAPATPRVNQTMNLTARLANNGIADVLSFSAVFGYTNATQPLEGNSTRSYPGDAAAFSDPRNSTGEPDSSCLTPLNGFRAGCTVTVAFDWAPPLARRGVQNLSATVAPGGLYTDPNGANNAIALPVFVAHHQWTLDLDPADDHVKQARPGDTAWYRLTVHNHGNLVDQVDLRVASEQWPGAQASTARATLAPGESFRFLALLPAPATGDAGVGRANATANATLAPEAGSARQQLPDTQRVAGLGVNFGWRPEPPAELFVASGGASNVSFAVRNTGGTEDALRWSVSSALPPGWNVTLPEPWIGLPGPGGATTTVPVRVVTNATLLPGASLVVALNGTARNGGQAAQANLTLRTAAPDLTLRSFVLDRAAVYRGDVPLLVAEVQNVGLAPMPKATRLAVEALNGTGRLLVGETLFSGLGPGDLRPVVMTWDTAALQGAFDLVARLDPDGELPETHEDNNNLTVAVTVRLAGLNVTAPAPREVLPGEALAFEGDAAFRVRNTGNAPEEVVVAMATDRDWGNASVRLRLAPGAEQAVSLQLRVPPLPGTLRETVRVTATLANRSATSVEAALPLTILDREAPVLVELDAPAFVELGTTAEFRATLRDAVGVANATLHLRLPDATVRTHALEARRAEVFAATVVLAQPGAVTYWVRAVDAAPTNNTLDTANRAQALLVGVRSAPLVELVEPRNNSVLRSGTPLRLRITDVHGVGEVQVREGGQVFDLEAPYTVPTAGLGEGVHTFEVVARNRFGNPTVASFVVTIDDTPPRVQDGRVEPARPAPGQDFTVLARASQDVRIAVVQVLRDSAFLREVPARAGIGEVEANLSLDAGRYTLVVRVEDPAGNVASLDLPVDVGAGAPGPPAALGWLAVAAAALLARRLCR